MKLLKIMLFSIVIFLVSCNKPIEKVKETVKVDRAEQLDIKYHQTIDSITDVMYLDKLKKQIGELHRIDSIAKTLVTKQEKLYNASLEKNGKEYTDSVTNELYNVSMEFTRLVSLKMTCLENNLDSTIILDINESLDSLNRKFKTIKYE